MQPDASDARTRFLALQTRLRRSEGADEQLLKEAAAALDEAVQSGVALAASEVEPLLLRPPWSDFRPDAAAARGGGGLNIDEARRLLCVCRPRASALLDFLDARQEVHEPHRRLGEQRHRPWAAASVRACVAAVRQAASHTGGRAPLVLVAEGSLGAEAAAAAAAGGRVVVCEPNRFAAAAVRAVAARHGVTVVVRPLTLEALCAARGEEARADVLVRPAPLAVSPHAHPHARTHARPISRSPARTPLRLNAAGAQSAAGGGGARLQTPPLRRRRRRRCGRRGQCCPAPLRAACSAHLGRFGEAAYPRGARRAPRFVGRRRRAQARLGGSMPIACPAQPETLMHACDAGE